MNFIVQKNVVASGILCNCQDNFKLCSFPETS